MRQWSRETRKCIQRILVPCFLILGFQIAEGLLHRYGLVLRTALQIGKGIGIWTILPILIVIGIYRSLPARENRRVYFFLSVLVILLILGISYARMGIYLNTGECKIEEQTEEGILICTNYNGSGQSVYEPVYGVFRTPFRGWEEAELLERLQERYGNETEIVQKISENQFLCMAASSRTGVPPFYFQTKNDYWITGNFKIQLMKRDASVFWKTRNRYVSLIQYSESDQLELSEEVSGINDASDERRLLNLYCGSREDAPACAADLADWYFYVREEKRYLEEDGTRGYYDDPLTEIRIFGDETFYVQFDEIYEWMETYSWLEMKQALEERLMEQYALCGERNRQSSETEETEEWTEEERKAALLEQYDGEYYEKECLVGDGTVRYRMICVDAALGSRAYSLLISTDSGETWQVQELDPFDGQWGMGIDFTFLTEDFGFAALMHNGGYEADLYVTEDGGHSYHLCVFQGFSVELEDGYYYQPYDYPEMPYEEEGRIYVLCGQGADGDYAGGDAAGMALYVSEDHGYTFLYQGIQETRQP